MTLPRIHIRRRLAFMRSTQILSVFHGKHSVGIWPAPGGYHILGADDEPLRFAPTALQAAALARRLLRKIA
jgi:allophanate hydrolase subunit 1